MANKKKKNNSKSKNVAKKTNVQNKNNKKVNSEDIKKKNKSINSKSVQQKDSIKSSDEIKKDTVKDEVKKTEVKKTHQAKSDKKVQEKKTTIDKAKRELVYAESGDDEIGKLFKVVLIVTAVIIVFYFVTSFVTKKASEAKESKSSQKAIIQYDNLIIGSMLNKDGEYYVLIEKDDDEKLSEYKTSIQMVGIIEDAPKFYYASLDDSFNKNYLSDEANYDSDLSNFKVKGTTLVKVADHEIKDVFDNYGDIKSALEGLQ